MTALELFGYVLLGILVQVSVFTAVALLRHMKSYQFLQRRLAGLEVAPPAGPQLMDLVPSEALGTPQSWAGLRGFRVARKVPEDKDQNICSFYLEAVDDGTLPPFEPGQFLTFELDIPGQGKPVTRCYSLSAAPGTKSYRVSIKRVGPPPGDLDQPPGLSSNYFHDHVEEGDTLQVRAPSGHFFLERGSQPVVLIGGGIGITPMLSMLGDSLKSDIPREIWLFYGVRNSADQAMKRQLEQAAAQYDNFHLRVCYSNPLKGDKKGVDYQHKGRIDVDLLRLTLPFQVYDFYICGPRPMMESLVPGLEDWGVPDQHINYEAFGPASITRRSRKLEAEGESFTVTFAKSGVTATWDGSEDTLLDFAEAHGVEITSGCRAGGCGSCQTDIQDGEVTYTQSPDYDPDQGSCLVCVSRPKQNLTLEA